MPTAFQVEGSIVAAQVRRICRKTKAGTCSQRPPALVRVAGVFGESEVPPQALLPPACFLAAELGGGGYWAAVFPFSA